SWWVVSIPLGVFLFVCPFLPNGFVRLVVLAVVTYVCIKRWQVRGTARREAQAEEIARYGSQELYEQAQALREGWPAKAASVGLCQRAEPKAMGGVVRGPARSHLG
ncbi:hypothetical protein JS562_51950, partial [Agrobacterium sp. S2]|nr:hypothetical protein [Agrobacterium sp. S2]